MMLTISLISAHWWCDITHESRDGCRADPKCTVSWGSHRHAYLTNRPARETEARAMYAWRTHQGVRTTTKSMVEEVVALCASHFGIPDTELEG